MIHYLCTRPHLYTLGTFLRLWAPDLRARFRAIPYEALAFALSTPQPGTYIFADLERLTPAAMQSVLRFRRSLGLLGDRVRVLNEPSRALRRYDLLRALYDSSINSFDVFRIAETRRPRTWPVLLRREDDHKGAIGGLLATSAEVDAIVASISARGESVERLIMVEFRDTADARGVYRKYGAFVIGDRIVPRHVLFSRHWCVKDPDLVEPEHIDEELRYVESFPHGEVVRRIFRIAGIDYGRIDYSFDGDRLLVWEINTNPMLATAKSAARGAPRRRANDRFVALAREAFLALDARKASAGA